ncbi:TonB-dependent receptor [Pedobacter gandavensis]|uniref:TonB-dependent receptor n=1 Tax=Pedobacter gandavensis TaxID=2679963 RepID=A0ABR6EQM8_9SPHI|nr:TonB-dependent receptor [Pedobacter gandavensis]MBB2147550.1 hypothetical protein [Pedobacter gandavensis]
MSWYARLGIGFCLTCSVFLARGQVKISGIVTNKEDGKPMPGLSVTVKAKAGTTMLTYGLTDNKGAYQLTFKTTSDSVLITVSGMSIQKKTLSYPNKTGQQNFDMAYEGIVLKELKVTPPKIRRLNDTLNYAVDQFTGKNDRTIGEVLKKMPGIKVAENGSITYQDKPINKFYIENQDLLEGRYGIATNNIAAKDVETVQVLENHQPIKALKNKEFTDEGALNLKLKDGAKNVWVANAQLGAGLSPLLWNNELLGTYFGKGKQLITTYKGNNTGDDSGADLRNFYGGDRNLPFPVSLGIQSPIEPGLSRKRYLLNQDHAFSLNHLRTLGKDYKLTTNISYLNDRQEKNSYSRTENFLPGDSTLVIEERLKSITRYHHLDGSLKLNANTERFYFENSLNFSGDLQRRENGTVENQQLISQERTAPYFKISNNLSLLRNYKKLTFRINSYNGYGKLNDGLAVQPMLYPLLFSDPGFPIGMDQSLTQRLFISQNSFSFRIKDGKFSQNYLATANASLLKLNSSLQSILENGSLGKQTDSLSNHLNWNRYDFGLAPEYSYLEKKTNISLKLPLSYIRLDRNDLIPNRRTGQERVFFMPSLSANYQLNLLWQFSAYAGYSQNIEGAENGYTGYVMQSYRYLVQNEGKLPERSMQSYRIGFRYNHPIKMVFASFYSTYYRSKMNLLYGNEFQDFLTLRKTLDIPNTANGHSFMLNLDKGFNGLIQKLSLDAGYDNSENTQLNQTSLTRFLNLKYSAGLRVNGKLGEWADFNYGLRYGSTKSILKNDDRDFAPIQSATQSGGINLFPSKEIVIRLRYENGYNSAVTGSGRAMNFADAGIRYRLKKLEFNLEYNNIFNTKRYIAAAYNGIGSYYSSYELRPSQVLMKVRFKIK